ncbi:MAG: cytochrome c4 [Chromatiaceae bacterium]|nr:MAG: cytochrome c4 [Chromatiaceae bacterium]
MAKHITKLAVIGALLALGLSSGTFAAPPTAKMLVDTCAGCHGTKGNSVGPAIPIISAMDPYVFIDMMEAYANDEIYSTVMGRIARGYTEEEIELMAEYLHEQEFKPAQQSFDESLVEAGAKLHDRFCEKCHIEGGKPVPDEEDYYILAGQWVPYLRFAMEDFIADRREMPRDMARRVTRMKKEHGMEESLEALYAFYAAFTDFESTGAGDDDDDE